MKEISPNLYLYGDICNVYVIKSGDKALCIDFGLGMVLPELSSIGIAKIEWVLHTHHHRDQCEGTQLAVNQGAQVAVPYTEFHFFTQAELFSNRRTTQHLYRMMADHFTLRESIPVAERLKDFSVFEWEDYQFTILPTPGHTMGSISLLVEIDGIKTIFCGDVIRDDAEIQTRDSRCHSQIQQKIIS